MTFQFQCPGGHLLEGEESQAGQQCQCPICQTLFIIPAPIANAPPTGQMPGVHSPQQTSPFPQSSPRPGGFPGIKTDGKRPAVKAPDFGTSEPEVLHIPCPECKEILESPIEMLEQDVICPHCQTQFQLRRRDSVEYKRKKQQELEARERRAGKAWLNWAIVIVVLVLLGLALLIFASSGD